MPQAASDFPCHRQPPDVDEARATCRIADWYAEGESRVVDCNGVHIVIRFVGRKGRRGRIVIEAPGGATFT